MIWPRSTTQAGVSTAVLVGASTFFCSSSQTTNSIIVSMLSSLALEVLQDEADALAHKRVPADVLFYDEGRNFLKCRVRSADSSSSILGGKLFQGGHGLNRRDGGRLGSCLLDWIGTG